METSTFDFFAIQSNKSLDCYRQVFHAPENIFFEVLKPIMKHTLGHTYCSPNRVFFLLWRIYDSADEKNQIITRKIF